MPVFSPVRRSHLVALSLAACAGCRGASVGQADAAESDLPTVTVAKPIVSDIPVTLPYTANIQAIFQAKSVPEMVSGYLTAVNIEDGQVVHKGDVIASIDKAPYQQQLQEAEERLEQARAEVKNQKLLVERYGKMLAAKLIAEQDYDNQETALEVSQAKLKHAVDALALTKVYLDYCDIRAPFTGYATERLLDPGQYISPQGPAVATVMKIDMLRVFIDVVEKDIPRIKVGQDVTIKVDAYPDRIFHGKVTFLAQAVHPTTRTMRVEADIPNADEALRPGMYAQVGIIVGEDKGAVLVPDLALAVSAQGAAVFPVREGRLARQSVEIAYDLGSFVEVKGLDAGEQIVVAGRDLAKLGERVQVVPTKLELKLSE
ncbi:MAG TPA: efflux RND transporter periplasmic adaptor subunit [Myxococcales bacterium]|nr:efflux RND transporter periplasmic adaptor subunit [Myxococcales bacterium]